MAAIYSIAGSASLSSVALQTEYSAKVASLQKSVQELQGDLALQLIEAAALDTGQRLDVVA